MLLFTADLIVILEEAQRASSRLRRRLGLSPCDAEDLNQELLVQLNRRMQAYDPNRGSLGAFVGRVLENEARRLGARILRARRLSGGAPLSLDAPDKDGATLGDRLSDGHAAWSEHTDARERAERRIDVAAALERLDRRDRLLLVAVAHCSVDELAGRGVASRAAIYRRLRELRHRMTAFGLDA